MSAQTVVYVYGIIPADAEFESGTRGVGDPPGEVRLIRHCDLAALVSDVDIDKPLGRPEDLLAHEELLDGTAAVVPVLPLRFGAIVANDAAVTTELLRERHDEFADALGQLEGCAEYVVKGRYTDEAVTGSRERDTQALCDAVSGHVESVVVREAGHELDAVHTAFLVKTDRAPDLERALDELARQWNGLIELRLTGPLAAYDFVGTMQPSPSSGG